MRELARVAIPALDAPTNLLPRTTVVSLPLSGRKPEGLFVRVALDDGAEELTGANNRRAL